MTTYNIPMDKDSYELFKEALMKRTGYRIDYDEDFQQAQICSRYGDWIEQTQKEYIITNRYGSKIYFINKQTGKLTKQKCGRFVALFMDLDDGIKRVYGDYEKDFIYDDLKEYLREI